MSAVKPWLQVPSDHPALDGHFPGEPIVPGALLLDEVLHSLGGQAPRWRIDQVKFHRAVRPWEPLQLDCQGGDQGPLRVHVRTGPDLVMSVLLARPEP